MQSSGLFCFAIVVKVVLLVILTGCDREVVETADGNAPARMADASTDGYHLILRGVVNDTLSGQAQFGDVYDTQTGQVSPVIEFVTTDDFAGGVFITTEQSSWSGDGRYSLGDGSADAENYTVVYRQGLYRSFRSTSGSLVLSVVSDTLIRGSFDAVMAGEVAERGRDPIEGEVEVSATFSARPGQPGYIIGL